ncbi:hypothetical protein EJ110_NYTH12192 [Nymphaea thermarum]|nr:hypothetical protein EJ110_NYTH12192 [Nymphaea thermarum]
MGDQIGGAATNQNGAAANKEDGSKRGGAGDKRPSKEAEGKPASCVIDVGSEGAAGEGEGDGERLCRVCHLSGSDEPQSGQGELIHLGCGCKNGLGLAHRRCAEAWFTIRGCRECEICGLEAKNVSGEGDGNFIEDWNGGRTLPVAAPPRRWQQQPFCTLVMVAVIVCLVLLWFFHVNR